ncbi:MAG: tetratricopeptide repeat protein [Cyanobacteria bacterium CRU_2_1]|nr:tetratricopeptide repeat protein [Cyanobacteria bacterium RU_5_0]NJR57393.1 tetratricopeptide repeat protein [Cyanobacteria bacterium CRU_2_1]
MLGTVLGGRYQIVRHLGGGGFGQTYLSLDLHLPGKPRCVVKQLKPKLGDAETLQAARRLFNQEAEVLYTLGSHEQIPRLFAHFEEDRDFYLVQEFIEGEVLSHRLKQGVMTEVEAIALLMDLLSILEFVHQQQVIHRDIKPSNLIRRKPDQKAVLIDFGVVKQISIQAPTDDLEQPTVTIAIGSSGYMPNEQLAGKPRFSSDIYAVGMVGIRALTGLRPNQLPEDSQTSEICWRNRGKPPNDARTIVSPEFADILDTMVRYDCRQRYQSATEALDALRSLTGSIETTTISPRLTTVILPSVKLPTSDGHLAWLERGDEQFQNQRYPEAIVCYDKVLQATPEDYLIWFKRGMTSENLHRYEEAIAAYDQVIRLMPDDYLAWSKRGKALETLKRYEEALGAYDKVVQIQPDNYWAWHDRGKVLERLRRFDEAVEAYNRAAQLKPDFQLAIQSRKRVLSQQQQVDQLYHLQHYDEAIASCEQAIRANPKNAIAWLMRGMALENLQQYEKAIASFNQVVKLQPDDHLAWFKRGTLLEKLKYYKESLSAYNQLLRIQPDNCWAWHDRGRVLIAMQRYEEAMLSYDRAVRIKPNFREAIEGRQQARKHLQLARKSANTPVPTAT